MALLEYLVKNVRKRSPKINIGRVGGLHSFPPTWNKVFLEALEQMFGFF